MVAPVPWFPVDWRCFGRFADYARVPAKEERQGIQVDYPRYAAISKVGMTIAPFAMYAACRSVLARLIREGFEFDLLDSHYFYPDGVAAVMLARYFGKPAVITARGSDLNVIANYRVPRRLIRWAAKHADGLITVCAALKRRLIDLGVRDDRITVLRNGVDLELFKQYDRDKVRSDKRAKGFCILSVGHLIESKGHAIVIRALSFLPECSLWIIGEGPQEAELRELAKTERVADRVTFWGHRAHGDLPGFYSAADVLVLASRREGWANILLEGMACGTPVVATNVGGTPEVVTDRSAGVLVNERTPECVADAIRDLQRDPPARSDTRHYAERFDWQETVSGQLELFGDILGSRQDQIRNRGS